MTKKHTIKLHKGERFWEIARPGGSAREPTECPVSKKAGDVVKIVRRQNPGTIIGVHAPDIGPWTTRICVEQGHGDTLWFK